MWQDNFAGLWIPGKLWLRDDLNKNEIIMAALIFSMHKKNGYGCIVGNDFLAEFFRISERQVRKILNSLEQKNMIKIDLETDPQGRRKLVPILGFFPENSNQNPSENSEGTPSFAPENNSEQKFQGSETPEQKFQQPGTKVPTSGTKVPASGTKVPGSRNKSSGQPEQKFRNNELYKVYNNPNSNLYNNLYNNLNIKNINSSDTELVLELDPAYVETRATEFELELHTILPARTNGERTTWGNLKNELCVLAFTKSDLSVFDDVLSWAKEAVARKGIKNPRAVLVKKCKSELDLFQGNTKMVLTEAV